MNWLLLFPINFNCSSLVGRRKRFTRQWSPIHESVGSVVLLPTQTIDMFWQAFDKKVGIKWNQLLFLWILSMSRIWQIMHKLKLFRVYSVWEWFVGVYTSIKSTKIKFIPIKHSLIRICYYVSCLFVRGNLERLQRVIGKQWTPRANAAFSGAWSGAPLFANN